jgi:hypothetical protein
MQNLAVGVTTKVSITSKLTFQFDGAVSIYTRNIKDTLPIDVGGFGIALLKKLMTVNMTSSYYTAFKTSLAYKFTDRIGASVEYRRIDPDYQSMGSYFCNNDIEQYTINANAGFWKNKVQLRGSLGMQHDNLGQTKKFTSNRTVSSFAGTVNFNQNWGLDANYSNFSTNQRSGRSPIIDSLRLFQVNHNISVMPRFTTTTTALSHFVMLNVSRMQLDDKNKNTASQTETTTTLFLANYSLSFLKTNTNLSLGLNCTFLENNMYKGETYGGSIGAAQPLFKDKLSLNWTNSFMLNKIAGNDGSTFNSYLSADFRPHPKHVFNFSINYINNTNASIENSSSFNEIRGEFRYAYSF